MRPFRLAALAVLVFSGAAGFAEAAEVVLGRASDWQLGMQSGVTPVKQEMENFHNLLLWIISAITLFVLALMIYVVFRFSAKRNPEPTRTSHNTVIEVLWTIVPVLILLVIAVPSFRLLYYADRTAEPELTVVAHGYQWYWGYELPDQQIPEYASYMVPEDELTPEQDRMLSTDNPLVLPVDTNIQILTTAGDVLHSFGVPSMGLKTDAIPGRMNESWARIEEEGTFYGMCSEICGDGHAYMPIEIRAVSREAFDDWVVEQTAGLDLAEPPVLLTMSWEEAMARRQLAQADHATPPQN